MHLPPILVKRWRLRLAEHEQLLVTGSPRFQWLRRVYARIYRFLLSAYGDSTHGMDPALHSPSSDDDFSRMPLVDNTLDYRGLQPRSREAIRGVLKDIHAAAPIPESGSLTRKEVCRQLEEATVARARETEWVALVRSDRIGLRRYTRALRTNGVYFRITIVSGWRVLQVRRQDLALATSVVESVGDDKLFGGPLIREILFVYFVQGISFFTLAIVLGILVGGYPGVVFILFYLIVMVLLLRPWTWGYFVAKDSTNGPPKH